MTDAHRRLVRLAISWAREHGFTGIATEVRLPNSNFRADVAVYKPGSPHSERGKRGVLGTTAVFECKQARSDFLKDSYRQDATRQRLKVLDDRRQKLEELLKLHMPSLRRGEALFAEFDAINLDGFEHRTYRRVLREMGILQRRLAGKTKFDRLARYRCANLNYLVIEPGILAPEETPVGWGLLHRDQRRDSGDAVPPEGGTPSTASNGGLILLREPIWQEVTERDRLRLLENIAAAAARQALGNL
jgi:hypothetical protein